MAGIGPRVKAPTPKGVLTVADPSLASDEQDKLTQFNQDQQFPQIDQAGAGDALKALGLDPNALRTAPGSISSLQVAPVRANPDILAKAQRDMALMGLVRSFTGSAPVTSYGAKLGQRAGQVTDTPGSQALQALIAAPVQAEGARVDTANKTREALNALAMGQAANVNANTKAAQDRADRQQQVAANAGLAKEQQREFDVSQQTAKDVASIRAHGLDKRMLEAQNKPPETPVREGARLAGEMLDFSDELKKLIQKGAGGSTLPLGASIDIGKLRLGTNEANRAKYLQGAIKGHLAQIEERRKGNQLIDGAIGGIVPFAGEGNALSLEKLGAVDKIGNSLHDAVANASSLWAYNSGIPRLKAHVSKEMLHRAQRTYSQQLEDALREQEQSPAFDPDAFLGK